MSELPVNTTLAARPPTVYLNRIMASKPATTPQPPDPDKPPGYQPSTGRKLFMLGLCIAGLIFLWTYYYLSSRPH
jgi:hypothetical protein